MAWHGDYKRQVDWERYYLNYTCKHGVVLFWMPKHVDHDCSRSYAQTTRVEWGRMYERFLHNTSLESTCLGAVLWAME